MDSHRHGHEHGRSPGHPHAHGLGHALAPGTAHAHAHIGFRGRAGAAGRALRATLAITAVFMVVEVVVGFLSNSLALLADAGHMFTDMTALLISLFAVALVTRPANARMTYGYYRLEILAALVNGILLLVLTGLLVIEALRRIGRPPEIQTVPMLIVAVLGLAANLAAVGILHRGGTGLNIRSAMLHVLGDVAGSVATVLAAVVILLTGWTVADPLISLVISALIVLSAGRVVWEAVHVLMEATPAHLDLAEVEHTIMAIPGVTGVHDVHAWTVTSGLYALSAHVVVDPSRPAEDVLTQLKELLLEHFDLVHTTLQMESQEFVEVKGHV